MREVVYSSDAELRSPIRLARDMSSDLWRSRELAWRLLMRDLRAQYRQSLLGYFWLVLPPLATTAVWVFLRGEGVIRPEGLGAPYPLFVLTGFVLWDALASAVQCPLQAVRDASAMLAKIRFPREALILAGVGQVLFHLAARLVLLAGVFLYYGASIPSTIVWAPLFALGLVALGLLVGLVLVPVGMLYQDVSRAMSLATTFWFFLTPVVYPPPVEGRGAALMTWNPAAPLLALARDCATTGDLTWARGGLTVLAAASVGLVVAWAACRLAAPHLIARLGG